MLLATLGTVAALAVTGARADPPADGRPVTVFRTVTEDRAYQGRGVRWWAARATQNARERNAARGTAETLGRRVRALQRRERASWTPTVGYAIRLASRVFGVDEGKMWVVARCESTLSPFAVNGRYRGLFQLGWLPFGLSPFDPVANALSTAQTVARDGSWRQWACG